MNCVSNGGERSTQCLLLEDHCIEHRWDAISLTLMVHDGDNGKNRARSYHKYEGDAVGERKEEDLNIHIHDTDKDGNYSLPAGEE